MSGELAHCELPEKAEAALLIALVYVALYCVGLVACYRRWRATGVIANAIFIAAADVVRGTWEWSRPHHDAFASDWACHGLGALPLLAVCTPAALVALWSVRDDANAREGIEPTFWTQLGAVLVALAIAAMPAVMATLEWGVMILGCDTL